MAWEWQNVVHVTMLVGVGFSLPGQGRELAGFRKPGSTLNKNTHQSF